MSMAELQIRFDDGAAYERMMGVWSRLAGEIFLDWLAPRSGFRWVDARCGHGALTQPNAGPHPPAPIQGVHPSDRELATSATRTANPTPQSPRRATVVVP